MKLAELLGIERGVTALIGGGGKTTLMYHLAEELREAGTVLVCTTTKIWPPEHISVVQDAVSLQKALRDNGLACAGTPVSQGKLGEPSFPWRQAADYILVEADGSAGRPFKAHNAREPVLPEGCHTILIMGAAGFGKPISEMAHRPALYARLAGVTESDPVTPIIAARVAKCEHLHDQVFLNQADEPEAWVMAREFAALADCPVAAGSMRYGQWERIQ